MNDFFLNQQRVLKNGWVFLAFWLLVFLLYIPAGKAGWVIDGVGFLYNLKHQSFLEFINRTKSEDQSFYQLFTLHYYLFYKLWGFNVWLWSLLYITVQAINSYLLFRLFGKLLSDSGIAKSFLLSLTAVVIFTVSPHISEIVVCKAYYHYLQVFMFILLILLWVQKYQHQQKSSYILGAIGLYILATLTLEIFYLTPVFVLFIALYYRFGLDYDKKVFRKTILYFVIPQLVLLGAYFLTLFMVYKGFKPHKLEVNQTLVQYLAKLPKYLFHILFLGRYFSLEAKKAIYGAYESETVLYAIYGVGLLTFGYILLRFRKLTYYDKLMFLLFILGLVSLLFLIPLSFPGPELYVFYDRYSYFANSFLFLLLVMGVYRFVTNKYVIIGLFCIYFDLNLYFTIQLNTWWIDSNYVSNQLLSHLPDPGDKIVVLLNLPENMDGAPMIGAQPESQFKVMKEIYTDTIYKNTIYDAASYNMITEKDGAHTMVINDSVLHVTLNQWQTWWWYEGHGAKSYETKDYKLNMIDPGHWYELILKHPASQYLLLYQVGDVWKQVDWKRVNEDQY